MDEYISSRQNSKIKAVAALQNKKKRMETGLFLVEGIRLVEEAVQSGWKLNQCFYVPELMEGTRSQKLLQQIRGENTAMIAVSPEACERISDTQEPQGVVVTVERKQADNPRGEKDNSLWVVLDGIQDPGNMGNIIRIADAVAVDRLILLPGCADPFAPKTVRSSMGSIFHVAVEESQGWSQLREQCMKHNIRLVATALEDSVDYHELNWQGPLAIIFGNEGQGVQPDILAGADCRIKIPIYGQAESLNVGNAAAVILYEAARQRR